jgi:predicted Zn-dependent protease
MDDKPAANTLMAYGTKRAKNKWKAEYTFAEQLMVRKEYKDALPHLQAATKSPNTPVIAWKQLGHAYEKTGNLKKSLETWQYIVKKFPDEPSAPNNLKRVQGKVNGTIPTAKTGK